MSSVIYHLWKLSADILDIYRVIKVVREYVLLTLFMKFHHFDQLLRHFCPILTSLIGIGQKVEQPKCSQHNLVSDHHGPVCKVSDLRVAPLSPRGIGDE